MRNRNLHLEEDLEDFYWIQFVVPINLNKKIRNKKIVFTKNYNKKGQQKCLFVLLRIKNCSGGWNKLNKSAAFRYCLADECKRHEASSLMLLSCFSL